MLTNDQALEIIKQHNECYVVWDARLRPVGHWHLIVGRIETLPNPPVTKDGQRLGIGLKLLGFRSVFETGCIGRGELTKLRVLAVGGPTVNDETITKLAALPQLQYLYLSHADISGEIVTELNESQPNLTIIRMDDRSHDYSAEINSRF